MEISNEEPSPRQKLTPSGEMASSPSSLASLVGRQRPADTPTQPVIPVTLDWTQSSKTKLNELDNKDNEISQILEEIVDPAKVKVVAQFKKTCKAFLDATSVVTSSGLSPKTTSASLILNSIVERYKDGKQKKLWPKTMLWSVIEECSIAASSCSEFVLLAIDKKDLSIVKCCIDHMQDIPDSLLTRCIQFYIRYFQVSSNLSSVDSESAAAGSQCPITLECAQCINRVLRCPYNDTFITDSLKRFSFDEALVLLRYLHYLLSTKTASEEEEDIPSLNVIADWISALLDAHFTQLLISLEARTLLEDLAKSVEMQELFYTELEAVNTILQSLKEAAVFPEKQTTGNYSIEVLSM